MGKKELLRWCRFCKRNSISFPNRNFQYTQYIIYNHIAARSNRIMTLKAKVFNIVVMKKV